MTLVIPGAPKAYACHSLGCIDGRPNKSIIWIMGSPRKKDVGVLSQRTGGRSD